MNTLVSYLIAVAATLLVGLPLIIAIGFQPEEIAAQATFFEIFGRLSGNLTGFLLALVVPRAPKPEAE